MQAIYCTEACRDKDASGHFIEHNILPYHHSHEAGLKELMSTRIIAKAGPELLFKLFQRKKNLRMKNINGNSDVSMNDVYFNPGKETVCGHNECGVFESESYLPIYHLISHKTSANLSELVYNVFRAIVLTNLLRDTSNFFSLIKNQYSEKYPQEQFEEFVGSLFLRHTESIEYNAVSMSELRSKDLDIANLSPNAINLKTSKSFSYATAIFCLISLANHSCDPNVVIAKKAEFQQTSLVTIRHLNVGDEIFITYKPQFMSQVTEDRRMFLLNRYQFNCQCHACVGNWSVTSSLTYKAPSTKCLKCSLTQKNVSLACKACDEADMAFELQLEAYRSKLYEADDLLESGDCVRAIYILQDSLKFFSTHFPSVFSLFQVAQDLYKRALLFVLYSYE